MARSITLTNILASDGMGHYPNYTSNVALKQTSSHVPGDGALGSHRITPAGNGESTISSVAKQFYASHIYYFSFKLKFETDVNDTFDIYWPVGEPAAASNIVVNTVKDVWVRVSIILDKNRGSFVDGSYQFRFDFNNVNGGNNIFRWSSAMLFDLTEAFGAGKEPSKEWMDTHITAFGDSLTVDYTENLGELFTNIASAIKSKTVDSYPIFAADFPQAISGLSKVVTGLKTGVGGESTEFTVPEIAGKDYFMLFNGYAENNYYQAPCFMFGSNIYGYDSFFKATWTSNELSLLKKTMTRNKNTGKITLEESCYIPDRIRYIAW